MKMDSICRLCLRFSPEKMMNLTDNTQFLLRIRNYFNVQIALEKDLPQHVCQHCELETNKFHIFYENVVKNEESIIQHQESGSLEKLYAELKDEKNCISDNKENILMENEICTKCKETDDVGIKTEISDSDDDEYSSGEDLRLSEWKKSTNSDFDETDEKEMKLPKDIYVKNVKNPTKREVIDNKTIIKHTEEISTNSFHKIWKCLTCTNSFKSRASLLKHYKTDHATESLAKKTEFKKDYKVIDDHNFKCLKCGKVYNQKRYIERHMITHLNERPFHCSICGRTYKTASEIVWHGRAHSPNKTLTCSYEQCGYRTVYFDSLRTHEKRHTSDFKYKCEKCNKGFQVKTWYDQHQNLHSGEKPFVCDLCGRAFHVDRYLTAHKSTVHPQSFTVKKHRCVHCGALCDTRNTLKKHLKEHGIRTTFLCDVCGKSMSSAELLKFHKKVHLGEKPHSCSTCGKAFLKKCNLQVHERTHSGIKPHACGTCGKSFTQKTSLTLHVRYHTGSRPYQCTKCPKAFVSKNQLTVHGKSCL